MRWHDPFALREKRLNRDALTPDRPAPKSHDVSIGVAKLARGDTNKLILPGDPDLCYADFERALKISLRVKEVLNEGKGKFIAADMGPGSVLRAAEWDSAV